MNYKFITNTKLFQGISMEETDEVMKCINGNTKIFKKGEFIYREGQLIDSAGLILAGEVYIEQDDIWGNKNIITNMGAGELFSEVYACLPEEMLLVNVIAAKDSEILFLNIKKIMNICHSTCSFHTRLVQNLLSVLASNNLKLTYKINHTAPKGIRDRVMSYLSYQVMKQGKYKFEIPFSRQQLADYLCVERSALSNELSKMQKDGLITYKKNSFIVNRI